MEADFELDWKPATKSFKPRTEYFTLVLEYV